MGIIYINDGFRKSKQPVDIGNTSINNGGLNSQISVGDEEDLIIQTADEIDYSEEDETLNIN